MCYQMACHLADGAVFCKNGGLLEKKGKMCHEICRSVRNSGDNFLSYAQKWYLYLLKKI